MNFLPTLLASTTPPLLWLDTVQNSPLTPWVGGALLFFIGFTIIKMAAKFVARLVILAIIVVAGFLGWNWCEQPQQRTFTSIRQDWFTSVKGTDFSRDSIEALVKDSGDLLKEAVKVGRSKGQAASKDALQSMCTALEAKIVEATKQGKTDAKAKVKKMLDRVRAELKTTEN